MAKKWQKKELDSLKGNAALRNLEEWAQELGREESDVQAKLEELGLQTRAEGAAVAWYEDPIVGRFNQAIEQLQAGKWKKAQGALQGIVADSEIPEVAEKARQMLRVCDSRLADASEIPEDPFLGAVFEKNRGNYSSALELCKKGGRTDTDDRFAYLAASIHALAEQADEAVAALHTAVQLNPKNRVHAFHDPDFEGILDRPELEQLFEAS